MPLERLVGEATGLVDGVSLRASPRERAGTVLARLGDTAVEPPDGDGRGFDYNAMGKGPDREAALRSVLGEFAERYAAHAHDPADDETVVGSHDDLVAAGHETVPFRPLVRYDGGVFDRFGRDDRTRWLRGHTLADGTPTFVPAGLVYATETNYFHASSNGWACHETTAAALASSLLELVERDAVVRSWFLGRSPDRLAVDLPAAFPELDTFDRAAGDVTLLALAGPTSLSTVAAAYRGDGDRPPAFLLTASAATTRRRAVRDAVTELSQAVQHYESVLALDDRSLPSVDPTDPDLRLGRNVEHYLQSGDAGPTERFLDGDRRAVDLGDGGGGPATADARFRTVRDALVEAGTTPVGVDLTTPDLATTGLVVTGAVVPELVPLCRPAVPPSEHPVFSDERLVDACHPLG